MDATSDKWLNSSTNGGHHVSTPQRRSEDITQEQQLGIKKLLQ